jgi:hypothetical protein
MEPERSTTQRRLLVALGAVVVVVAAVLGGLALTDDDEPDATTTTSSSSSTSTTAGTSTTIPEGDLDSALFPDRAGSRTFDDPEEVARAFAVEELGFEDPLIEAFAAGDSRSGEVVVRFREEAPPTVVLVRQLSNDAWYVLGAAAEPIVLTTPTAGAVIEAPQPLAGQAYAFEGTVNVALYVDGIEDPIAETVVTGRGDGILGDFSGEIDFTPPSEASRGRLVLRSLGGENGTATLAATAVRVRFR